MKALLYRIEKDVIKLAKEMQELQEIQPIISEDLDEAKNLLKNNDINLIVSGANNTSIKLFEFIKKTSLATPFVWYTSVPHDEICSEDFYEINSLNKYLDINQSTDDFFNTIRNIILVKENAEISKYVRIEISRIIKHDVLNADIFVRLSDNKVVKIISKNKQYDKEQVLNYKEKLKYLYVKTNEYPGLIKEMYKALKNKLNEDVPLDVVVDAQLEGIKMITNNIKNFSIDSETEEMLNEITASCVDTVQNIKSLKSLFDKFMDNKEGYLHRHSLMIGYLTSLAAGRMKWNAGATLQKLTIAGILHDTSLNSKNEAEIKTISDIESSDLASQDKQRVRMHALETADLIRNLNDIPPDVDSIVLTHHELPDGSGFPRGLLATQVSQIAALFIIGEEFVNRIYDKTLNKDQCFKILEKMKLMFDRGNYRKPYWAFREMIESYCN